MTSPSATGERPALWHYLLLYAVVAVWIDFGHIHLRHHSDSLIFTLAGQYAPTPFFWEQDRVGLLVPILTSWCPGPLIGLLMQTGVTIFLGLAASLLAAEAVCPRPASRAAATLANGVMLAVAHDRILDIILYETTYPTAIALGCAGLIVLGRGGDRPAAWRYFAAAALFVLAHWVYVGVILLLAPLAFGIAVVRPGAGVRGLRETVRRMVRYVPGWASLVLLAAAFGIGLEFMRSAQEANPELIQPTPQRSLPRAEWTASWLGFFDTLNEHAHIKRWPAVAGGLALAGLLTAALGAALRRTWPPYPLPAALAVLALAGATEFLVMGTRFWPAENHHEPRYIIGFLLMSQVGLGMAAVFPLAGWIAGRGRWLAFGTLAFALVATATYRYGLPAPGNPRADLDEQFGAFTPDVLAADVDAIGGEFWTVWPAVFHANMAGSTSKPYFGVTLRSSVFRAYWEQNYPERIRVAVPDTEKDRNSFIWAANRYGLTPPVRVGTQGRLIIYTTSPTPHMR